MEIKKISYVAPVNVIGTDDDGRTLVMCPDCGDTAHLADDGRLVCPTGEAIGEYLRIAAAALTDAEAAWLTRP